MMPVTLTVVFAAAVANGIAQSQTPGGAGNLTLNGSLVSGGVAALAPGSLSRQVLLTFAADETGHSFTIYGTNYQNQSISEVIAGTTAGTVPSVNMYKTVTRVAISAAAAGAIVVGTNGVGRSSIVAPDIFQAPFNIGLGCELTGTANFTVQHTFDDVMNTPPENLVWLSNSGLTSKSTSSDGNYAFPVRGISLLMNSGTGSVVFNIVQGTHY